MKSWTVYSERLINVGQQKIVIFFYWAFQLYPLHIFKKLFEDSASFKLQTILLLPMRDALMRFRLYVHHHLRLVWHAISSVDTRSFFLLKTITKESTYFTGKREGMQMK
jgi:hypothetical protein